MAESAQALSDKKLVVRVRTAVAGVLAALVLTMLWVEFSEAGNFAWNVFLAAFLLAVAVATAIAMRYFRAHAGEVGEARFETPEDRHG